MKKMKITIKDRNHKKGKRNVGAETTVNKIN